MPDRYHTMFAHVFNVLLRHLVLPAGAIWVLSSSFLGEQVAFLGVIVVLTIITIPLSLWHLLRLFPNIAFIRTNEVTKLAVEIALEILIVLGFWGFYYGRYLAVMTAAQ